MGGPGTLPSARSPAGYCIRQAARFAPCLIYRLPPEVYHGEPVLSYGGYVEKVGEFAAVELEEVKQAADGKRGYKICKDKN